MGEKRKCWLAEISPFPMTFSTQIMKNVSPFVYICDIISLFVAELKKPEIGISDKELIFRNLGQMVSEL